MQGPSDPSKVVRLVQVENRSGTGDASAYNWPEQRFGGGWRDYTRDVLAVSYTDAASAGRHVDTPARLTPNYTVEPDSLETAPVDKRRTFLYEGVAPPSAQTPNEFPINGGLFPQNRLDQPRAGTVEEWTILNYSSLHHPFHVHTQYGRAMEIVSPVDPAFKDPLGEYPSVQYRIDLSEPSPASHTQDVINIPPARIGPDGMPVLGPGGLPVDPGKVVVRVRFEDFLGTHVEQCHRLPHEDRGMMSLVSGRSRPASTPTTGRSPAASLWRPSYTGGVTVTTGYPFAADGGFATVLVTNLRGPARLNAYTVSAQMHDAAHHAVSISGVMMPSEYQPAAPRHVMLRQSIDLSSDPALRSGAVTASLSNTDSASLLVAPARGGRVTLWSAQGAGAELARAGKLRIKAEGSQRSERWSFLGCARVCSRFG